MTFTPNAPRTYAIADVHGMSGLLAELRSAIEADVQARPHSGDIHVVFLGDYGDRGADTKGVVDQCIAWQAAQPDWQFTFIRGNHDQELLAFLENPKNKGFLSYGGLATLASYGVHGSLGTEAKALHSLFTEKFPDAHRVFYEATVLFHVIGNFAFVHGGLEPHVPLEGQSDNVLLYHRLPQLETPHYLPYRVVCGHTILPEPLITHDRVCLDTGAYMGGKLTCAILENEVEEVRVIQVGEGQK